MPKIDHNLDYKLDKFGIICEVSRKNGVFYE